MIGVKIKLLEVKTLKNKLERFSKGEFEYELPLIHLSEEEIKITVETGKTYEGSFTISNSGHRCMKGLLYSSSKLFVLGTTSFCGEENVIKYQFKTDYIKEEVIVQGEISIVSDCGEQILPFVATIESTYCMTSMGKIKDLFHFTNLAKVDWSEAKKVFKSEEFGRMILDKENKYNVLYRNLLKSSSTSQALEEFLIAIRKKSRINISIDKTNMEYQVSGESFMDKLILTKDHWGYAEIKVSTDAPFIRLEQKFVWADNFIGNTYQISYIIDPKFMRQGNNFGKIFVKTVHQTIAVDIICKCNHGTVHHDPKRQQRKKLEKDLVTNYLKFRMNQINSSRYITDSEALLEGLSALEDSKIFELMKTHLAIISGKDSKTKHLLEEFAKSEVEMKKKSIKEYCAYLYLDALYKKDDQTIRNANETIRNYYENGCFDWPILWFLLYTDKRYNKNKSMKLTDIKEQFNTGCHSPILYYEAVCIYNEEPSLLHELTGFEIQVFSFAVKYGILLKEAALQYTYLANKEKKFHKVIFRSLARLYDVFKLKDILSAICSMLIKGLKKSEKYFEWFRLGVEAQLRITELYEYYMYTISENKETILAQPVLLYFIYNSSLNDHKRAFLYANIVKNKATNESLYRTYYKRMEVFTYKLLEAHQINPNLAILYDEIILKNPMTEEVVRHLPYVMYCHELKCDNRNIKSVTVVHKERVEEEFKLFTDGKAQINIFTENAEIFLVDSNGNRFTVTVDYSLQQLLKAEDYAANCANHNHPMLILHLLGKIQNYQIFDDKSIMLRRRVLQTEGLQDSIYQNCIKELINYYYDNNVIEMLEFYLQQINLHSLNRKDRIKIIEYMIVRELNNKTFKAFEEFGFEGIAINRLIRLCSRLILNADTHIESNLLLRLSHHVFLKGKYDETILIYLEKHYFGTTKEMFQLWQAVNDFQIEAHELEERLLGQMLFTESYILDSFMVFSSYYKNVTNHNLVRAFLSYYAYKYLVNDRVVQPELFSVIKRELNYEENDICMLALLKHYTTISNLSENECSFLEYHIFSFEQKGFILPYFGAFNKVIKLPGRMADKFYAEYKTDPKNKVFIHYRLENQDSGEEFITERMQNVYLGIHVKEFILFYHEMLQYYITEEYENEEMITESFNVCFDKEMEEEETKYNQINLMLMAGEMKDDKTSLDLMENYIKTEYIVSKCFKQI